MQQAKPAITLTDGSVYALGNGRKAMMLEALPNEMIVHCLRQLDDPREIIRASGTSSRLHGCAIEALREHIPAWAKPFKAAWKITLVADKHSGRILEAYGSKRAEWTATLEPADKLRQQLLFVCLIFSAMAPMVALFNGARGGLSLLIGKEELAAACFKYGVQSLLAAVATAGLGIAVHQGGLVHLISDAHFDFAPFRSSPTKRAAALISSVALGSTIAWTLSTAVCLKVLSPLRYRGVNSWLTEKLLAAAPTAALLIPLSWALWRSEPLTPEQITLDSLNERFEEWIECDLAAAVTLAPTDNAQLKKAFQMLMPMQALYEARGRQQEDLRKLQTHWEEQWKS